MKIHENWAMAQGGVISRRTLLSWGNSDADIRAALRDGRIMRVRRGWFAVPGAHPDVVAAVGAGGCLSCVSALRARGVWAVDDRLHVRFPSTRLPPPGMTACSLPGLRSSPRAAVDRVPAALLAAAGCVDAESLLVLADSVVNLSLMENDEVERLFANASLGTRRIISRMAPAESGTETMVRERLRRLGVSVRSQVWIDGVGRVDLLVGSSLVIEVDSRLHHTSLDAYARDRERDRKLLARGFTVVRLTYHQVVFDWAAAESDIRALLRRGAHVRRAA